MKQKWTNPLVSNEKLKHYLIGDSQEVVFEKMVVRHDKNGVELSRTESVTRGFLLELLRKASSDSLALNLYHQSMRQLDQVLSNEIPQPSFDNDLFFQFMVRLQELESKLLEQSLVASTPELTLIVQALIHYQRIDSGAGDEQL